METTDKKSELSKHEYQAYCDSAISYQQYKLNMAADLVSNTDEKIKNYIKLNQSRMHRVEKTYQISDAVLSNLNDLKHKSIWLVITEHWCGDASQSLPALYAIAQASKGKIELKLVYRDKNPALINAHLSDGTKSIPKLIQLDQHFIVSGIWGPRPSVAQKLVKELKSNPDTAATYANVLHLWYAKDKQKSLESEVNKLINRAKMFCPDCLS